MCNGERRLPCIMPRHPYGLCLQACNTEGLLHGLQVRPFSIVMHERTVRMELDAPAP